MDMSFFDEPEVDTSGDGNIPEEKTCPHCGGIL